MIAKQCLSCMVMFLIPHFVIGYATSHLSGRMHLCPLSMPVSFGMAHLHMTIINIHIITYKYTTFSIAPRLRFDEPNRNPLVMAVIPAGWYE